MLEGIGTISRAIGIFVIGVAAVATLYTQTFRRHIIHGFMLAFGIWGGLTYFWSIDQSETEIAIFSYAQLLVMTWLIFQWTKNHHELIALFLAYVLGCWVAIGGTVFSYLQDAQTVYLRYAASGFDVNDLAVIIALGIPMSWYLSFNTSKMITTVFYRLYPAAAFFTIFLTASRAGFILALISLIFIIGTYPSLAARNKIILPAAAVIIILSFVPLVPIESVERIMTIGHQLSSGDLNARVNIWQAGLEIFNQRSHWNLDFLWGKGLGTFYFAVAPFFGGLPAASHNVYLSILIELGVVGFLIFSSIIAISIHEAILMPKIERLLWIVLLLQWVTASMSLSWLMHKCTWLLFGLLIAHACSLRIEANKRYAEI
jgi:O-antigen ligase